MCLRGRNGLLCALAAVAALVAPGAAAARQPGDQCSSTTVSAANQYCEDVPSATGGHQVGLGTPALAGHLPPSVVRELNAAPANGARAGAAAVSGQTRTGLLRLPAPGSFSPLRPGAGTHPSSASLLSELIVVLAAATVLMGALALARRRRGTPA
jgi:hypothetical protein